MFFKSSKKLEDKNNKKVSNLITQLNNRFPITSSLQSCFALYPFSNESNYSQVLDTLKATPIQPASTETIKVVLLFGESNFLSMLPELDTDLVVLSDIEPKLHLHTQHELTCFHKSNSPEEFIRNYAINNPIENLKTSECYANHYNSILTSSVLENMLTGKWGYVGNSLGQYHFLSSPERFNACKKAAQKLMFTQINFNLLDKNQSKEFAQILTDSKAILTLCNFTNIHDYDEDNTLKTTIPLLLKNSTDCFIMYSTSRGAFARISKNITDYYNYQEKKDEPEDWDIDIDLDSFSVNMVL